MTVYPVTESAGMDSTEEAARETGCTWPNAAAAVAKSLILSSIPMGKCKLGLGMERTNAWKETDEISNCMAAVPATVSNASIFLTEALLVSVLN